MSDIDQRIKAELEKDTAVIDALLAEEGGMPDMVAASFKGGMRRWVTLMYGVVTVVSGLMFWSAYRFYDAESAEDTIFWGISVLVAVTVIGQLKNWIYMEMNRSSLMREIKRLELAIATLAQKQR